jgi:hypothetical protein
MMKWICVWILVVSPLVAQAEPYGGMGPQDRQRMMQAISKMQACMQTIDQSKMRELGKKSERVQQEIKRLCAAGKRAQAQSRAIAYGLEMAKSPLLKKIKHCSSYMKGVMPMPGMNPGANLPYEGQRSGKAVGHVCDSDM